MVWWESTKVFKEKNLAFKNGHNTNAIIMCCKIKEFRRKKVMSKIDVLVFFFMIYTIFWVPINIVKKRDLLGV